MLPKQVFRTNKGLTPYSPFLPAGQALLCHVVVDGVVVVCRVSCYRCAWWHTLCVVQCDGTTVHACVHRWAMWFARVAAGCVCEEVRCEVHMCCVMGAMCTW